MRIDEFATTADLPFDPSGLMRFASVGFDISGIAPPPPLGSAIPILVTATVGSFSTTATYPNLLVTISVPELSVQVTSPPRIT